MAQACIRCHVTTDNNHSFDFIYTANALIVIRKITQKRWRWIGHVVRMDNNRICTTALTLQPDGELKVGLPKKHGEEL